MEPPGEQPRGPADGECESLSLAANGRQARPRKGDNQAYAASFCETSAAAVSPPCSSYEITQLPLRKMWATLVALLVAGFLHLIVHLLS